MDISRALLVEGYNAIHIIALHPDGSREVMFYRRGSAASRLAPEDVDDSYIASARFVHSSGITQALSPSARAAVRRAFEVARQAGVTTCFDPNLRLRLWPLQEAQQALMEILPLVDIVLCGAPTETGQLVGISDPHSAARYFHEQGVKVAVLKMGAKGSLASDGTTTRWVPAHRSPNMVDQTGAGDAFNGGFLAALCRGHSPLDAAAVGAVVAGLKVLGRGQIAPLPRLEQLRIYVPWF